MTGTSREDVEVNNVDGPKCTDHSARTGALVLQVRHPVILHQPRDIYIR